MAKSKVSLGDIAKKLNISKTTVSFILNDRAREKRINDERIAKALKFVDEINYKPNYLAKGLRTGKTNEPISQTAIDMLMRQLKDHGKNVKSNTEPVLATTLVPCASSFRKQQDRAQYISE